MAHWAAIFTIFSCHFRTP